MKDNIISQDNIDAVTDIAMSYKHLMFRRNDWIKLIITNPWSLWSAIYADVNCVPLKIISPQPYGGVVMHN